MPLSSVVRLQNMLKRAVVFVLGMTSGIVYLFFGATYIGWNASDGYGPKMIEWSLSMRAVENPMSNLIYFHDVSVFLILAILLGVFATKLVSPKLMPLFALGVLTATIVGSFELLAPTAFTMSWIATIAIVLIPLPVLVGFRKLLFREAGSAA